MSYLPLDLIVQRKEKRQSESNEKAKVLRERVLPVQPSPPSLQASHGATGSWVVCRTSPGMMHRVPGRSLANAPSCPGLETGPRMGPRVLLQHHREAPSATWESIPCLLLYPEFIMHLSLITYYEPLPLTWLLNLAGLHRQHVPGRTLSVLPRSQLSSIIAPCGKFGWFLAASQTFPEHQLTRTASNSTPLLLLTHTSASNYFFSPNLLCQDTNKFDLNSSLS